MKHVDVAIIGAGSAGLNARRAAKAAGAKSVLMIDPGPHGTTCARVGCMPSKLMIAAAEHMHHAKLAPKFGVQLGEASVDPAKLLGRVRSERDRFVGFVKESIEERIKEGEMIEGRAVITAPGQLSVKLNSGDTVEVAYDKGLVIAAGGVSMVPPPFRGIPALSNEDIFEIETLPESLLVVGTGVIGLELGQTFHRLGCRTTLVGIMNMIGPISDPVVLDEANRVFSEEMDFHSDYVLHEIKADERGVHFSFTDSKGNKRDEHYEKVLMAAGRVPATQGLGLEKLGFEDLRKLPIDPKTLQLGDQPVFFAGDVNNLHPLLHEAADDGEGAGRNAARPDDVQPTTRRTSLGVVFTDPQIGTVGLGYRKLDLAKSAVGEIDYGDQGRARVHLMNAGKVRVYSDIASRKLIGAEMFGPRVEHTAHLLAWSVQQGLTVDEVLAMPFYHPVFEEGIRTALRDLAAKLDAKTPIQA